MTACDGGGRGDGAGIRGGRRVDADGAWKRVLSELLAEFVAFTLPALHEEVDWGRAPAFLEQELRPVLRRAAAPARGSGRRVADLVVQVWLRNGEATWLLIHVEVQGQAEDDFAERMFAYAALLYLRFRDRRARRRGADQDALPTPAGLIGIAVLTDPNPAWQPGPFGWGWREYGIRYRYHALKLTDWRDRGEALAGDGPPFAWVVRTWLAAQVAGRATEAQAEVKRRVGRQLFAAGRRGELTAEQTEAIYAFLELIGGLPEALSAAIDAEWQEREGATMQHVLTRYERRALERGLEQGREEGRHEGQLDFILLLLAERCGPLDDALRAQVAALDGAALLDLGKALLHFADRDDLRRWLAARP